jgi:hypothetical protein
LAYVLLTGRHPFAGRDALQARELDLAPERPSELPTARWAILRRGLSLERKNRFDDISLFAEQFARPPLKHRLFAIALPMSGARRLLRARPESA